MPDTLPMQCRPNKIELNEVFKANGNNEREKKAKERKGIKRIKED